MGHIKETGFENSTIQKEKTIELPDDILAKYLSEEEIDNFKNGDTGIYSITVFAQKPGGESEKNIDQEKIEMIDAGNVCEPGSGCC
ncbi:MAG: hypothetical protein U5J89_08780 [Fodinibius sp.]|nr:hypothetical protein [Fodinibius sp.]MDZ7659361.1 hypothetical protein [Fodinibius sp.]